MRNESQTGFTVFGLAAIVSVLLMLLAVMFPAFYSATHNCDMTSVGIRGRDVYVAITGANTEREALNLPPVWPSDCLHGIATNGTDRFQYNFDNSTDYFRHLFESKVCGDIFDYTKLASGNVGVTVWTKGLLTAENNMWTIAKNVRDEMNDMLPILITRNVDVASLPTNVSAHDGDKKLKLDFDPEWKTPFGNKAFVLIRKGGAIFKAREKYSNYHFVYQDQLVDTSVDAQLRQAVSPLSYLAPTYEVVNGEKRYSEKAYRDMLAQHGEGVNAGSIYSVDALRDKVAKLGPARKAKRDIIQALHLYTLSFTAVGFIYVAFGALYRFGRKRMNEPCSVSGPVIKSVVVHGVAVSAFFAFLAKYLSSMYVFASGVLGMGVYLAVALVVQIAGTIIVARLLKKDPATQRCGIKWMVSAPLVACALLIAIWAVLSFLYDRLSHLF